MQVAATGFSGKVVKDPVCGGDVNEGKARSAGLKSEYQGLTHYFCSYSCNKQFDQDPERYLAKTPAGSGHGVAPPLTTPSAAAPTAPTAMSKDPICNQEVDEAKATAAGLVSEYQEKTYFFFNIHFKKNFDADPERYVTKTAGTQKGAVSPSESQSPVTPPGATPATPPGPAVLTPHSPSPAGPPGPPPVQPQPPQAAPQPPPT